MISEVSPTATVVLDGSGNGQCNIGPPSGTRWALALATVATSTATKQPQVSLYRGSASGPIELVDSTYNGSSASSGKVAGATFYPGQRLWAVWTGGDAGATATLQAFGQQGSRSDPFEQSPVAEGFPAIVRTLTLPFGASTGTRIVLDGVTGKITLFGAGGAELILDPGNSVSPAIEWAPGPEGTPFDASLTRVGVGELELDQRLDVIGPAGTPTATVLAIGQGSQNNQNFFVRGGGALRWSDGTNPSDTTTYRSAAGVIGTDKLVANMSGAGETWHNWSFLNSWVTGTGGGGTDAPFQYKLMPDGTVQANGIWQSPAGAGYNQIMGQFPTGYRPAHTYGGSMNGNDGPHLWTVDASGNLTVFMTATSTRCWGIIRFPIDAG